jgi:membrane protein
MSGRGEATAGPPGPVRRLGRALGIAVATYTRTECNQRAAAISYRVLFSLVPFVSLLAWLLELLLPEETGDRLTSWLVGAMPLEGELEDSVARAVEDVGPPASLAGLISLLLLLYGASGMMGATRSAFGAIWGSEARRPYLRGKLVDVALVLAAGLLVLCAFGVTIIAQIVQRAAEELVRKLGGPASATEQVGAGVEFVASAAVTFVAFLVLYRFVPTVRVRLRDAFAGALVACAGFNLAAIGFSIYIGRFADFDDVFGPLSAVFVFLLVVYLAVAVLLLGASLAAAWPGSALAAAAPGEPGVSVPRRLVRAARGLVIREPRP